MIEHNVIKHLIFRAARFCLNLEMNSFIYIFKHGNSFFYCAFELLEKSAEECMWLFFINSEFTNQGLDRIF